MTAYLEETGTLAAVNSVDLVARIPGFVTEIQYTDGAFVKKGAPLFQIEPPPYKAKWDQAIAAVDAAKAQLANSEAEFERQADLVKRQVSTQANYDKALAQRDSDKASLLPSGEKDGLPLMPRKLLTSSRALLLMSWM